tara:strand:+ start:311 stop:766 length:456 start_codon:yes stop_codon:yes gene_type:complete
MKQVISLVGGAAGAPILSERLAGVAGIVPGMLVNESAGTVIIHVGAGLNAQRLFAQTNLTTAGDINAVQVNAETVSYGAYSQGQQVNALVGVVAAIVDGDALESAGDGTLQKAVTDAATDTTQRDSIVGYAMESIDNSGGSVNVRIKIRVA